MRERDASKSPEKRLATLIRSRFARERMRFVPGLDLKGLVFTTDLGIVRHLRFNGDLWEVVLGIEVAKLQNLSLNLDETLGKDCWRQNDSGLLVHPRSRNLLREEFLLEALNDLFGLQLTFFDEELAIKIGARFADELTQKGIRYFRINSPRSDESYREVLQVGETSPFRFIKSNEAFRRTGFVVGRRINGEKLTRIPFAFSAPPTPIQQRKRLEREKLAHANFSLQFDPLNIGALHAKANALTNLGRYHKAGKIGRQIEALEFKSQDAM